MQERVIEIGLMTEQELKRRKTFHLCGWISQSLTLALGGKGIILPSRAVICS